MATPPATLSDDAAREIMRIAHKLGPRLHCEPASEFDKGNEPNKAAANIEIFVEPRTPKTHVAGALVLRVAIPHDYPQTSRPHFTAEDGGGFWKPNAKQLRRVEALLKRASERRAARPTIRKAVQVARKWLAVRTMRERTLEDDVFEGQSDTEDVFETDCAIEEEDIDERFVHTPAPRCCHATRHSQTLPTSSQFLGAVESCGEMCGFREEASYSFVVLRVTYVERFAKAA